MNEVILGKNYSTLAKTYSQSYLKLINSKILTLLKDPANNINHIMTLFDNNPSNLAGFLDKLSKDEIVHLLNVINLGSDFDCKLMHQCIAILDKNTKYYEILYSIVKDNPLLSDYSIIKSENIGTAYEMFGRYCFTFDTVCFKPKNYELMPKLLKLIQLNAVKHINEDIYMIIVHRSVELPKKYRNLMHVSCYEDINITEYPPELHVLYKKYGILPDLKDFNPCFEHPLTRMDENTKLFIPRNWNVIITTKDHHLNIISRLRDSFSIPTINACVLTSTAAIPCTILLIAGVGIITYAKGYTSDIISNILVATWFGMIYIIIVFVLIYLIFGYVCYYGERSRDDTVNLI